MTILSFGFQVFPIFEEAFYLSLLSWLIWNVVHFFTNYLYSQDIYLITHSFSISLFNTIFIHPFITSFIKTYTFIHLFINT